MPPGKRILVTAAGGAPSVNFARSLRDAPEPFHLVGCDCDRYSLFRAEADERVVVPRASDAGYVPALREVVRKYGIDFVHAQPDAEVGVISRHRDELGARTFLPARETVEVLRDKFRSFRVWRDKGLRVPETVLIESEADLRRAFDQFGDQIWVRETSGAAGKGALASPTFALAREWIDSRRGWGRFAAARRLTKDTVTWMSLYDDGELVVAQGRRRLNWLFGDRTQSGVTGITGVGETVAEPVVDDIAQRAVAAVDPRPNGIFSVDLTYDQEGVPNPTEINVGKFFTTHYFFTKAGLNMPYYYVKLAFGEPPPPLARKVNPLPAGLLWVRGMDVEPVLVSKGDVEKLDAVLPPAGLGK